MSVVDREHVVSGRITSAEGTHVAAPDTAIWAGNLVVRPLHANYRELVTPEAFDWQHIVDTAKEQRQFHDTPLYLVVFRSILKAGADTGALQTHDLNAHIAAQESPELIHYFADEPDANGRALSFCLWNTAEAAKVISRDPRHVAATKMVNQYAWYDVERHDVHHAGGPVQLVPHE